MLDNIEFREAVIRLVGEAVNEVCTCGGGGPGDCCGACEVWHEIQQRVKVHVVPGQGHICYGIKTDLGHDPNGDRHAP